jgi:hypothetical protein
MKSFSRVDRRSLLAGFGRLCLASSSLSASSFASAIAHATETATDKAVIARWMNEWMVRKAPAGTLHVSRFKDGIWFLTKPIGWKPDGSANERFKPLEVPTGFVTDFASIPRVFWSLLPPDGEYTYPAILHDYLYWIQERTREESDEILKLSMQEFGIRSSIVTAIYNAVRIGGGASWSENERIKKRGEKRILVQFPDDPRIRWTDWKKKEGVFP